MAHSSVAVARTLPILVVENIRWLRDGIASMLRARGWRAITTAQCADDAVRLTQSQQPRVALFDSGIDRTRGPQLVEALKRASPATGVVVIDFDAPDPNDKSSATVDYIRAGATGFIMKDATADEFIATIRAVATGACVLPPQIAGYLCAFVANRRGGALQSKPASRLTSRERDVCALIADGFGNKEIGDRLHISTDTVKSHVHSVLAKLGLHTRLQIATYARPHRDDLDLRDYIGGVTPGAASTRAD